MIGLQLQKPSFENLQDYLEEEKSPEVNLKNFNLDFLKDEELSSSLRKEKSTLSSQHIEGSFNNKTRGFSPNIVQNMTSPMQLNSSGSNREKNSFEDGEK